MGIICYVQGKDNDDVKIKENKLTNIIVINEHLTTSPTYSVALIRSFLMISIENYI
jgi:hypothetical protein